MDEFELEMLITGVQEKYDGGQDYDLTERQVKNIALKLLEYDLEPEDFIDALEYTVKIRKTANFYKLHCIRRYDPRWNYYFSIGYQVKRVLVTMGLLEGEYNPILFNINLEDSITSVEDEIRIKNIYKRKMQMQ